MSIFKKRATTENYREFKRIFNRIQKIGGAGTTQEIDMTAGYLCGVVTERATTGRLTHAQREALLEMIEAKQTERRAELEAEENEEDFFRDTPLYKIGS